MGAQTPGRSRTSAGSMGRNPWAAVAVVCLSVLVIVLDNTIMNVALPSIERALHADTGQLQWVVDAYTLVFASLLLTAGTIGDRYGRRGTLMGGLAVFGTGSALAAFSPSAGWLIAFRALMGVGAAAIYPTTLSIITNLFEGQDRARGRAIGIWAALAGVGVALGPILGGVLLQRWWWGSVLLVNVPVVATSLILIRFVVPTSRDRHPRALDLPGTLLSIVGLTVLLFGIIEGPRRGWTSAQVALALAAGLVVLGVFVIRERHAEEPMLPLTFFGDARFSAASVALSLTFFGLFGYIFLLTQYLQFVRGLSPLAAGLRLASPAIGLVVGAPLAPRIVERVGTKRVVAAGLFAAGLSLVLASRTAVLTDDAALASVLGLFGLGMGMTMAPATESIMGSVPPARAGVGSAINDTTRQAGGALGVAVLGSMAATRYDARLGALRLPPAAAHAARQAISTALAIVRRFPPAQGQRLASSIRDGFTSGVVLATLAGAVVVLGAALVTARYLPARARQGGRHEVDDGSAEGAGAERQTEAAVPVGRI